MITPEEAKICDAIVAHDELTQDLHKAVLDCGTSRMRRVCSWCSLVMDLGTAGAKTTHGICTDCRDKFFDTPDSLYDALRADDFNNH
jgi:hypothetical protein